MDYSKEELLLHIHKLPSRQDEIHNWFDKFIRLYTAYSKDIGLDYLDVLGTIGGVLAWKHTGHTPQLAHQFMIRLGCKTQGLSNEIVNILMLPNQSREAELFVTERSRERNDFFQSSTHRILPQLRQDGYILLENCVERSAVFELQRVAMESLCRLQDAYDLADEGQLCFINPGSPRSVTAWVDPDQLVNSDVVGSILRDPFVQDIVSSYLGSDRYHVRKPALWWSFPAIDGNAKTESAQLFHFDYDAPKWLKLFVYLSPVDDQNGPHVYIPGSHKPLTKPPELLARGYARIPDQDILRHYPNETPVKLVGPLGTAFFGDTHCWHKGEPVLTGHRLTFSIEFASTSFQNSHE